MARSSFFQEEGRVSRWRDGHLETVCDGIPAEKNRRFNDATADPAGRVITGSMQGGGLPARLYCFERDGSYHVLLDNVEESNGMAFSLDGRTLFHTDTGRKQIRRYTYDPETSRLAPGDTILTVSDEDAVPDGLTIDCEETLWSARWGGSCVIGLSPEGEEVSRTAIPTDEVSSVAFGGPNLDLMFVTTAGGDDRTTHGPLAGSIFVEKRAVPGRPPLLAFLL